LLNAPVPIPAGYHEIRPEGLRDGQHVYVTDQYEESKKGGVDIAPGPIILVTLQDLAESGSVPTDLGLERIGSKAALVGGREMYAGVHADSTGDGSTSTPVVELTTTTRGLLVTTNDGTSLATLESFAKGLS
jgi:hypothetical protein